MIYREDSEPRNDDAFREIITSCRSLSSHEKLTLKSALPQVIKLKIYFLLILIIYYFLNFIIVCEPDLSGFNTTCILLITLYQKLTILIIKWLINTFLINKLFRLFIYRVSY